MSNHHNFDAYAGIHFRNLESADINGYGNAILRTELAARGVGTLIIPGTQAYDFDAGSVTAHRVEGADSMILLPAEEMSLRDGLDVVRARVITPRPLEEMMPVLNGPRLREIGGSKWRQYEIAGDYMPPTIAIDDTTPLTAATFEAIRGDKLVIKADLSQAKQFFKIAKRDEVASAILEMRQEFADKEDTTGRTRQNRRILVQEYAQGTQWPELVAVNEKSKAIMDQADDTELRMYSYVDADRTIPRVERHYASGYAFHDGTGDWFSIEQGSVPQEAWDIADTVSTRMLEAGNVVGGYFAIDLFRAENGRLMVREINTRDPMMVTERDNKHDELRQRQLLAGVMATVAQKAYNKG